MELHCAMTTDPFTLILTAYLIIAAVMVGLCRDGSERVWMVPDLDWSDQHGVGAPQSHGHSLDGASDPCKLWRRLSNVPTDDERVLPRVFLRVRHECRQSVLPRFFLYQLG